MNYMNCSLNDNLGINSSNVVVGTSNLGNINDLVHRPNGCWGYWQDYYYPQVIRESYPVYIQERAKDKAKQAYEIVKILKDKKIVKLEKVSDFINLMDELIKIL